MAQAILITQCLQNDFVKPLPADGSAKLPNLLHVGADESRRLMGENPAEGPVAQLVRWAARVPPSQLKRVHIRDWHEAGDAGQAEHFRQFGKHCVAGTDGAEFVFKRPEQCDAVIVDATGLNDFLDTTLDKELSPYRGKKIRVGIAGVWTEAKVTFLAYELRTRYPEWELGVCSALAAGSSRAAHFIALEQLQRLLGVRVFSSLGEFTQFLASNDEVASVPLPKGDGLPVITADETMPAAPSLREADEKLLRYLFRDCKQIWLRVLDGGFSGNMVASVNSVDRYGHKQSPHVIKVGAQEPIGRERTAFERIEAVLGNNAPRIVDFADFDGRGALKYRYASMGSGSATSFQKLYMEGASTDCVERILRVIFEEQLGRFYAAAEAESTDLLSYYCFSPELAPRVAELVSGAYGAGAERETLAFASGRSVKNVTQFYKNLATHGLPRETVYFAFVHGDLNGANIIIDSRENVWLIDFFHTHRGHVVKDLVKLENDLLYIFTPLKDEKDLEEGLKITDALLALKDLQAALPSAVEVGLRGETFVRAWQTIGVLRSLYNGVLRGQSDPLQIWIAQLRYAGHTLCFDESSALQKKWALYTACRCAELISQRMEARE